MAIKNLIFDLGVVIIGVDTSKTKNAFEKLGVKNFNELYTLKKQNHLFDDFEKGIITDAEFRKAIAEATQLNAGEKEIDEAWNAMLGTVPQARFDFLDGLKSKYRIFLLSNTNIIHWRAFSAYFNQTFGEGNFEKLFEQVYYSFETGMRKPEKEMYDLVLEENKLNPSETLFIDDNEKNIEGAKEVGFLTLLHKPESKIEEYLLKQISTLAN